MVANSFKASNILEKQVKTAIISKVCEEIDDVERISLDRRMFFGNRAS